MRYVITPTYIIVLIYNLKIMCEDNKYIRFDWAIKHLLRNKANFGVLEGLVTVLTGEKVKIEEILESEGNQENAGDKFNRVDIKARNSKGHLIIVEVQLTRQLHFIQRMLYGVAKAITEHINLGDNYDKVKKVYSINILYCEIGIGEDYVYKGSIDFKGINTGDSLLITQKEKDNIFTIRPEEVFPEYYLIRVNQYDKLPQNPLDEWVEYLKTGRIDKDTTTPGLREAGENLQYLKMTEKERQAYDRHIDSIRVQNDVFDTAKLEGYLEGKQKGMAEGIKEGMAEGIKEGIKEGAHMQAIEIAKRLLDIGMAPEEVANLSNLTIEEVLNLK